MVKIKCFIWLFIGATAVATPVAGPPASSTGGAGGGQSEDALLQQALSLSMGGVPLQKDLSQMTEDEQIELALRMSMQQDEAAAADGMFISVIHRTVFLVPLIYIPLPNS